jgi:hypothetical protein
MAGRHKITEWFGNLADIVIEPSPVNLDRPQMLRQAPRNLEGGPAAASWLLSVL